jgi:FKBP-type peptidyl-prolyl cis-trans isomerase
VLRRPTSLLACAALAVALTACGDGSEDLASPSAPASATPCQSGPPATEPVTTSTTDLATAPVVAVPDSAPPCGLQTADVVVGTGAEAVAGAQAQVKYVGVLHETGEQFDSSWSRSPQETLPFQVGAPGIIPGFDQAVTGMRVGGRREVVIPSHLAYGPAGQGSIPPGSTLVFVIDLVEVTPA